MKALFIAPLPPPVTGNSLAVKIFLDELNKSSETEVVNLSKDSFKNGVNSLNRIIQIFKILLEIKRKKKGANILYFTIAESIPGNLKDILVYIFCFRSLPQMIIHLHGGAGMCRIMENKKSILFKINRFFIRRLGGVIVLGNSHCNIYSDILEKQKLHIVPNFAEDYLFLNQEEIYAKFVNVSPVRLLFLSNLIGGKGHIELVEAYQLLSKDLQKDLIIDFAGGFESSERKESFLEKIASHPGLQYHGMVSGEAKRLLFKNTHVFCLPTYYPYEGQPISILEAYASGCCVITTDHSGIKDVFQDGINGFQVEKKSVDSLKVVLEKTIKSRQFLHSFGLNNNIIAREKYQTSTYNNTLLNIFLSISN